MYYIELQILTSLCGLLLAGIPSEPADAQNGKNECVADRHQQGQSGLLVPGPWLHSGR
jgi:hypothetical protein